MARARLALAVELALLPFMDGTAPLGQALSFRGLHQAFLLASRSLLLPNVNRRSCRHNINPFAAVQLRPFLHRLLFLAATHRRRASRQSPFPQPIHPRADLAATLSLGAKRASSSSIRQPSLHSRPSPPSLPHPTAVHSLLPLR